MTTSPGARFLSAFNDIEDHFRTYLNAEAHVQFAQMAREYGERKRLTRTQQSALTAFAVLRNAISHGRYYDGRPIAEPVEQVVEQIERLRDQLKSPPTVLAVLKTMKVRSVAPSDAISAALEYIREYNYSQLPVHADNTYQGLLTTNAIARWLAAQLKSYGGLAESESVGQVLLFAEPNERAALVPRTVTASDAMYRLGQGGDGRTPFTALIVTHNGKPNEEPLAVVVAEDVPALANALALY